MVQWFVSVRKLEISTTGRCEKPKWIRRLPGVAAPDQPEFFLSAAVAGPLETTTEAGRSSRPLRENPGRTTFRTEPSATVSLGCAEIDSCRLASKAPPAGLISFKPWLASAD